MSSRVAVVAADNEVTACRPKYYWESHRRHVADGRIAWYAEPSDDIFWFNHWKRRVNGQYYSSAVGLDWATDELACLLLKELCLNGLHVEAGCGAGFWVAALKHRGLNVEGIEYSRDLVELVNRENPALSVRYGDATSIECPDNHYDSYLSFGVVEHRMLGPEPFLIEAHRVLKPAGKMVITVPYFGPTRRIRSALRCYERACPPLPFFQYGFSHREFTRLIESAGFIVTQTYPLFRHRLLLEEFRIYRWAMSLRGCRYIKKLAETVLRRCDGHMLAVVAEKPGTE